MATEAPNQPTSKSTNIEVVHDADTVPDSPNNAENGAVDELPPGMTQVGRQATRTRLENSLRVAARREIDSDAVEAAPLTAPEWLPPAHVRYRLLTLSAIVLSVGWVALGVWYVGQFFGFGELVALLPHEIGGMAAGFVTPLALIWLVVGFTSAAGGSSRKPRPCAGISVR